MCDVITDDYDDGGGDGDGDGDAGELTSLLDDSSDDEVKQQRNLVRYSLLFVRCVHTDMQKRRQLQFNYTVFRKNIHFRFLVQLRFMSLPAKNI